MAESNASYHARRAADERRLGTASTDPTIARAHLALAELHERRARDEEAAAEHEQSAA